MLFRPSPLSLPKGRVVSTRHAQLTAAVMAAVVAALPAQIAPGLQFAEMGKRHLPRSEEQTNAVVVGDVDGDGDLDMVCGNNGQNRLYLNNGGIFTDATATRMPVDDDYTTSVALGDVDGDGDLDLVCGNAVSSTGSQNRLFLNNGGTFTDATASSMPVDNDITTSVALGDVDGDGDLDMVCGNTGVYGGGQNRLYLNTGGTFTDATATGMPIDGDRTSAVAFGDVDGDGDLDLVCGNSGYWFNGSQNRLYLNSAGTFVDATTARMPFDNDNTGSVALGDIDGDGDLDLVCGNSWSPSTGGQNRLYLNTGGTFADATATRMPVDSDVASSVALGDVDGDGDLDMVVGDGSYYIENRLYLNNGGVFVHAATTRMPVDGDRTMAVALGDVDGDGDLDLLVGNYHQINRLYVNNGGSFVNATVAGMPVDNEHSSCVALGDVDGDGDLDVVVGNYSEQNRLFLNGGGVFTDVTSTRFPVDSDDTTSVVLGDVDADGDLDLVIGNRRQQNRLYLNIGGAFTDATPARMPVDNDSTTSVVLGDVDGDGDLDLVIGNGGQQNRLYLNMGGAFTDATATRMPVDSNLTTSVALGDVDRDGDLDLVCGNTGVFWLPGDQNRLYLNTGGTFTDSTANSIPVDTDWTFSVAFGDVDGDGDLDLVCGNRGQNRLYLNAGGTFADATATRMPVDFDITSSLSLGDADGDGDLDLFCSNRYGQNRLYLNSGGSFTDVTVTRMPADSDWTLSVALGDIDGDGDLDMICGNQGQNRLYANLHRQLDAPFLLRAGRPYTLEAYSRYGLAGPLDTALIYLSTARLPAPVSVAPYGTLVINPMAPLPFVSIPQASGVGIATWMVPNNPAFAGIDILAQAAIVQGGGDIRLSNVTGDVILR